MKFWTVTQIEFHKLFKQRFSYILLGIIVLVEIVMGFIRTQASTLELLIQPTAFELTAFISASTMRIAAFMLLAFSAMSVASEASQGTLKTLLVKPFKRKDFIIGKAIMIFGIGALVIFIVAIIGIVIGGLYDNFEAIKEGEYVIYSFGRLIQNFTSAYLLTIIPLYALCTFGIFCSVLLDNSGTAVSISIGFYFFIEVLSQFDEFKNYLVGSFVTYPLNFAESMAKGLPVVWTPDLFWCIGNSVLYTAVFLVLSLVVFQRKDII